MTRTYLTRIFVLLLPAPAVADDFGRGLAALQKKDYDQAIACFTAHIRQHPRDAEAYIRRGAAYDWKEDYGRAIADFTQAIRLDPKDTRAYIGRGYARARKKEYDQAIGDFAQAIRLNPDNAKLYCNRGFMYGQKKEYGKAIADFTEAIRLDPMYPRAYFQRGTVYDMTAEYGKAIADYSRGIRLDPKDADGHNALARSLAACPRTSLRDGKRAVRHATKACELSDWKMAHFLETLAAAHAECGDFKEAAKWQKKAMALGFADKAAEEEARSRLKGYEAGKPYGE